MASPAHPGAGLERRHVDGVVLIDKPSGLTSNAALQRVKRAFRAHKGGHTGTLDPLATGLLPVCLGEATKFSQGLLDSDKTYRTEVKLGVATETGDAEGRTLSERPVEVGLDEIEPVLAGFRGSIEQVPHRYSALKRDGRRLYDYARAGEQVSILPRTVRIDELVVEAWSPPILTLRVRCSKGTYVRSLAEDIGAALGCGAHVTALRRLAAGRFQVNDSISVEALEAMTEPDRDRRILPDTTLVADLPRLVLRSDVAARFTQGQPVSAGFHGTADRRAEPLLAIFAERDSSQPSDFLGFGRACTRDGDPVVVPVRLLASRNPRQPSVPAEKLLQG